MRNIRKEVRAKELEKIIKLCDFNGELRFLIKWNKPEFISNKEANLKYTQWLF